MKWNDKAMNHTRSLTPKHDASAATLHSVASAFGVIAFALALFVTNSLAAGTVGSQKTKEIVFRVSFGGDVSKTPLDGRLLVMLSTDPKDEPRFQINDSPTTQQIFGIDVDG